MADQMGGIPPSPAAWEMLARHLQPLYLVTGAVGSAAWAIGGRHGSLASRLRYLTAGALLAWALGPLVSGVLVALLTHWGLPVSGAEPAAGFLSGAGGVEMLRAALDAARSRLRQIGGVPREPPAGRQ